MLEFFLSRKSPLLPPSLALLFPTYQIEMMLRALDAVHIVEAETHMPPTYQIEITLRALDAVHIVEAETHTRSLEKASVLSRRGNKASQ